MKNLTRINEHIHRLVVPYKDIFTTVYFIQNQGKTIVFDTAAGPGDVEDYILPAMKELGITAEMMRYVFVSHNHRDHSFGVERFLQEYPNACLVTPSAKLAQDNENYQVMMPGDGDIIMEDFRVVMIPGHTKDSVALLDLRTATLVTGDCLQMYGIFGSGDWGSNIHFPAEHLEALKKVGAMDIAAVVTAHDYHPYGFMVQGRENVLACLNSCAEPLLKVKALIAENPQCSDGQIAIMYNNADKVPTIGAHVAAAVREAVNAGRM